MTSRDDLPDAAYYDHALDEWPQLGPVTPCLICCTGLPQRHRVIDAILDRIAAGEEALTVADDYGVPVWALWTLADWARHWRTR